MGKGRVVLSTAVGFFMLSFWAGQAVATDCSAPTAAPKHQVGDTWTWRDEKGTEVTNQVIQVEGDEAQIKWSNGDVAHYDTDRIIRKVVRANGEILTK